jgi:hypothetical protein
MLWPAPGATVPNPYTGVPFPAAGYDVPFIDWVIGNAITQGDLRKVDPRTPTDPTQYVLYLMAAFALPVQKTVSGPLTFSVAAGAIAGSSIHLRVVADGTNVPVFSGMTESAFSMGYVSTASALNAITFSYDGYDYWYSIVQQTAYAATSQRTLNDGTQVLNDQSSTTYTVTAADFGKLVRCTNASPITVTVPDTLVPTAGRPPIVNFEQGGAGQLTFVGSGTRTTINNPGLTNKTRAQYSEVCLRIYSATSARLGGDLSIV